MIICDALIIIWFVIHTGLQGFWIKRESIDVQRQHVQMTDFAVKVTHLPKVKSYDQLEEMAAALAAHITEVVELEP